MKRAARIVVAACVAVLALLGNIPGAAAGSTVVMSGLDNPRGLSFGPEGGLYVVEAGQGGTGPCVFLRGMLRCYGPTGALTRLWKGKQERVASGLPSMADPAGEATGPHDVSFRGGTYLTIGFGGDPALRAGFGPDGALFGTLVKVASSGAWHAVADVSQYEVEANPAGGPIDSNPYGLLAEPGFRVLTDAGGNSLLRVTGSGHISTLAVFPSRPARSTDSVPTAVVLGPDGAYYVSELTGVPFTDGAARIYRVRSGFDPEVYLEGFKTIIDLDFAPDGSLYVLEHATGPTFFTGPGRLLRVAPDGTRSVVASGLTRPTSVVVGPHGFIYISNRGTSIGTGEVIRLDP